MLAAAGSAASATSVAASRVSPRASAFKATAGCPAVWRNVTPQRRSVSSAHCAFCCVWQPLQALGVASITLRSGRGLRMA